MTKQTDKQTIRRKLTLPDQSLAGARDITWPAKDLKGRMRWNKTSTKLMSDLRVTVLGTNPYGKPDKPDSTIEVSETDWVVEQSQ